jgi:RES domain-containing protein
MAVFWRISNRCDLEGIGAEKAHGRWHTAARGQRLVYLSEHPAAALIEVLANTQANPKLLPDAYQLIKVTAPDEAAGRLSATWREKIAETRSLGGDWLSNKSSALLTVPSVPSPESFNCLFNPMHADARHIQIEWCKWLKYDHRLFRVLNRE